MDSDHQVEQMHIGLINGRQRIVTLEQSSLHSSVRLYDVSSERFVIEPIEFGREGLVVDTALLLRDEASFVACGTYDGMVHLFELNNNLSEYLIDAGVVVGGEEYVSLALAAGPDSTLILATNLGLIAFSFTDRLSK